MKNVIAYYLSELNSQIYIHSTTNSSNVRLLKNKFYTITELTLLKIFFTNFNFETIWDKMPKIFKSNLLKIQLY